MAARRVPRVTGRAVADTAPLLERDFARLAGLGWIGKNTMLIDRKLGSFTFLGALLVDVELEYDAPARRRPLRKLHALPGPLPDAGVHRPVRARRRPLHQLLDHRAPRDDTRERMPRELDGWVFGCDVCQDVCPWNRKAPPGEHAELDARPEWTEPDLLEWLSRDRSRMEGPAQGDCAHARKAHRGWFATPHWCWAAESVPEAAAALAERLDDPQEDPVVRASAAWALGQIGTEPARAALDAIERRSRATRPRRSRRPRLAERAHSPPRNENKAGGTPIVLAGLT